MAHEPDGLPPLRDVIRQHDLMAKKSLGQHFLLDFDLLLKIARAGGSLDGVTVVEIGPGPGGLTRGLLAAGAAKVISIERDQRCLPALEAIAARYPGRLEVHAADALDIDWPALLAGVTGPVRIASNLPYNVATPLLLGWVKTDPWPPWFEGMTLMFQREVAERIVAGPGDDAYGRLGVISGWRMDATILFDLPPGAFLPPPKVMSSVVVLTPKPAPLPCRTRDLERVTQAAFGQRRKMLRQSLKSLGRDPLPLLAATGIRPEARAEEIPIAGFVELARLLSAGD
jgi:16S rRNA (adenine1518-N6/adenine1519-N6)-dimethyltransferase